MSRETPGGGCVDVEFARSYAVPKGARVALEDYALALTKARAASSLPSRAGDGVRGVHLCSPESRVAFVLPDLEAFARGLAEGTPDRLAWS